MIKRTAVITQPTYLPWMGYFEQIHQADIFIFLDIVQFVPRSWHSRNCLKGSNNEPFWLTVPVMAGSSRLPLLDIRIAPDQSQWRKQHLRSIQSHLGGTRFFHHIFPHVEEIISTPYDYLVDLNIAIITMIAELLDLKPQFIRASALAPDGSRTRLLLNLCKHVQVNNYYSSLGSQVYMQAEEYLFVEAGIQVHYQQWCHPIYPQHGANFVSHLSILDALMNVGPKKVREFIGADSCHGDDR